MHYTKYQKQAVGSILLHSDRGIDSLDTHKHSNENIDSTKTHLNYDLKNRDGMTAYTYYKHRINAIAAETKKRTGKTIRKDAITLCSWVVTAPKDLSPDKHADFFRETYAWFGKRYGEDNIVTAAVHMDETSPHIHLQFTPIIEQNGIRKLCAKDIETKYTLQTAHGQLQQYLENALKCPCNVHNGATANGNRKILELKLDALKRKIRANESILENYIQEFENVLNLKTKASKLKCLKRGVIKFDKEMLDNIRAIAAIAADELRQANKIKEEAEKLKVAAEEKTQSIEPIYQKAQKDREFWRKMKNQKEQEIAKESQKLFDDKCNDLLAYMDNIKLNDGSTLLFTVLEGYNKSQKEKEQKQLKHSSYELEL